MIFDNLKNSKLYFPLGEGIQKGLKYLTSTDFSNLEPGRYEIDGDKVYAMVQTYNTKPASAGRWEAHKKYIDVQYVAKGEELIAYAPSDGQKILSDYNEIKDVSLFEGERSFIKIEQGMFAVFFPDELHMPGIMTVNKKSVKKVVVKIKAWTR